MNLKGFGSPLLYKPANDNTPFTGINELIPHTHRHLLGRIGPEQPLDEQMTQRQTHKQSAIGAILLGGEVSHSDEAERLSQQIAQAISRALCNSRIHAMGAVVVEADAVDDGAHEERPVGATVVAQRCVIFPVTGVVDGDEDVGYAGRVGEVGPLLVVDDGHFAQHLRDVGSHEDHAGFGVFNEFFALDESESCVS